MSRLHRLAADVVGLVARDRHAPEKTAPVIVRVVNARRQSVVGPVRLGSVQVSLYTTQGTSDEAHGFGMGHCNSDHRPFRDFRKSSRGDRAVSGCSRDSPRRDGNTEGAAPQLAAATRVHSGCCVCRYGQSSGPHCYGVGLRQQAACEDFAPSAVV